MRWKMIGFGALFLMASTGFGYYLFSRFLRDRQSAMTYLPHVERRPVSNEPVRTTRTYTAKELEEARKKGQLPKGSQPVPVNQAAAANEAAVQKTLQTIQEINRINEMNQRLQEQQQRMQRQNK